MACLYGVELHGDGSVQAPTGSTHETRRYPPGLMKKFRDIYRIPSARLDGWDYAAAGWYFVTICTKGWRCLFGDVVEGEMHRSAVGQCAHENWAAIPDHFDRVRLDAFVVMPNHVHGIIGLLPRADDDSTGSDDIDSVGSDGVETRRGDDADSTGVETCHGTSLQRGNMGKRRGLADPPKAKAMSEISPGAGSLGIIINHYKGAVTRWARKNEHDDFAWQPRFHDHIIRNERSLLQIRQYVADNSMKWHLDRNHPDRL